MGKLNFCVLLLFSLAKIAFAEVSEATLANGLRVIIAPDHRSPMVMLQIWYKVGSSDESNGLTGVSHALEHMMFKGSGQNHSKTIASLGGSNNAFTSRDFTAYYQFLPKQFLAKALELEASRLRHLDFADADLVKEKLAVLEERHMRVDDQPIAKALERFNAQAFASNPYHNPTVGWENDIKQYSKNNIINWHKKWYQPNNATIVIAGDVREEEALVLVKKHFNTILSAPILARKAKITQAAIAATKIELDLPIASPQIIIGYHVPSLKTLAKEQRWQSYALSLLSVLLADDDSGLLEVNDKHKLFNQISAYYQPFSKYSVLFKISGQLNSGKSASIAEHFVYQQIASIKKHGVSTSRLAKIKNMLKAQYIYDKDSIELQANQYGALASLDLPLSLEKDFVENISKVSAEQISLVAKKYFDNKISMVINVQK